nr:ATP-binding protein [Arcicella sp.]
MLVEFSVGNFRSFKDIQTLSMVAAPISSKNKELDEQNTFQATPKLRLLKTKAIYGANGSGKSNLVHSMWTFNAFILHSIQTDILSNLFNNLFNLPFFFSTESENEPSFFQMIFIANEVVYRYGFETNATEVVSEWLFATPNQREVSYFKREGQKIDINEKYLKGANKIINLLGESSPIFKKTTLFLSILSSLNNPVGLTLVNYFNKFLIDIYNSDFGNLHEKKRDIAKSNFVKGTFRNQTNQLLKFTDNSIVEVGTVEQKKIDEKINGDDDNEEVIVLGGKVFNNDNKALSDMVLLPFFEFASEGTKRIFDTAPFIFDSLENSLPIVIDEFDSKLHPIITKKIVELYNKNGNNAQLIFVTHDTNLLDSKLLRRDQIAFVEKDKFGASHLYDLVEFKGV